MVAAIRETIAMNISKVLERSFDELEYRLARLDYRLAKRALRQAAKRGLKQETPQQLSHRSVLAS